MVADDLHSQARFWLDVADKLIKLLAVLVGAAWTWMHYHRSRTYAQKLELQLAGTTFLRDTSLYIEVQLGLKNLGASRHFVQQEGTTCEIVAIYTNQTEMSINAASVFEHDRWIEPGESIRDLVYLKLDAMRSEIVWVRADLRVVGKGVQWKDSRLLKVDAEAED